MRDLNSLVLKDQLAMLKSLQHVSTQIRYLTSLGLTRGEVQRYINAKLRKGSAKQLRYQHVRGVLTTEVKTPMETWED